MLEQGWWVNICISAPFTAQSNFGPPFEQSEKLVPCFLEARAGEVIVKLNKLAVAIFLPWLLFFGGGVDFPSVREMYSHPRTHTPTTEPP